MNYVKSYANRFLPNISENVCRINEIFNGDSVLRVREFTFCGIKACILYFDGMADGDVIDDSIMRPLILAETVEMDNITHFVGERLLYAGEISYTFNVADAVSDMLNGDTLLLLDNSSEGIMVSTKGWQFRSISEPENERVLQGPRDGFGEVALFNVALLRRRLQTSDFCASMIKCGKRTNTRIFICYLKSLANRDTLRSLKKRLSAIDTDAILDSNYITEEISDGTAVFKTVGSTERPDIVAARLLEGRIAVVVDLTPVVLTVPYLFSENFQSDEDYYINYKMASAGRIIRIICFFLAISVSALYTALTTFHFDLLPASFATVVAHSREGVPFSTVAECFIMTFIFEILRETGVRMPQSGGHALSIVGGLVVGQAAVEAKIVSAPMLIVVALSGICGLMVPRLKTAVFYLRFAMIFAVGLFGLYGYFLLSVITLTSILRMKSVGVDATVSLNNPSFQGLKDVLIRASWRKMITRPPIQNNNRVRKKR